MIKNNLKIHDTFLVTVELLSSNAIIVSANIDSIIYRGALITCNTSNIFHFKPNKSTENCFSSKRHNNADSKGNYRLKKFKSDYNLRRTNKKITKAKEIVCKSELKIVLDDLASNNIKTVEPLSIKLKRLNGVYQNVVDTREIDNTTKSLKRKFEESDKDITSNELKRNIIKIKKIKLHTNQYHYSISTNEGSKDEKYLPKLFEHKESLSHSLIPHTQVDILPPLLSAAPPTIISFSSLDNCSTRSPSIECISDRVPDYLIPKSCNSGDTLAPESSMTFKLSDKPSVIGIEPSCNNNITKLKIIKKSCNSYAVKSSESVNGHVSRYNCKEFRKNDIIWAKLAGYSIWPAKVIDTDENDHVIVLWLGNGQRISRLHKRKLWDFGAHFHEKFNRKAKGHYLNAVEQAKIDYGKLDFNDNCRWHVDISSESSTLESINIDDSCYEFDRGSGPDLRTNVYLPVPDEEFELLKFADTQHSKPLLSKSFLVDSPSPHTITNTAVVTDMNI